MENSQKIRPVKVSNNCKIIGRHTLFAFDNTLTGFFNMKKCTKCGKIYPHTLEYFAKEKYGINGLRSDCKKCVYKRIKNYNRKKIGILSATYNHQKSHSKYREYNPPAYTKQELKDWLFSQKLFHKLFDNWVKSGYENKLKPSIDRKNDYKGYSLDNIQLMTWGENNKKSHLDRINGINNKQSKAVIGINKKTGEKTEFYSMSKAGRVRNIKISNISKCCSNKKGYKSAGGYIWKFRNLI